MNNENDKIIPVGKYKGQPIEISRSDPQYCEWLVSQNWFRDKFSPTYQLIINNFGEPAETPEHNSLQAMFLDRNICINLLKKLGWKSLSKEASLSEAKEKLEECRLKKQQNYTSWGYGRLKEEIEDLELFIEKYEKIDIDNIKIESEFEYKGWDVKIFAKLPFWEGWALDGTVPEVSCSVEIKTDIGDNYPAILRQMKANEHLFRANYRVLVFDKFTATGATLEQVKQIFAASGFCVVPLSEISIKG